MIRLGWFTRNRPRHRYGEKAGNRETGMQIPRFERHPLLVNGHMQTLAGFYLPWRNCPHRASQSVVDLPDGDAIVLHDDSPHQWRTGEPVALLIHGLAGCHLSPYMVRVTRKLTDHGIRVFRMDLRGCGSGSGLARLPYHAGRSEDVQAALAHVSQMCPGSRISPVGFSLSGNILLKFLGEFPEIVPPCVERAVAVNPPIDLLGCVESLAKPSNQIYDRHFVKLLYRQVRDRQREEDAVEHPQLDQPDCLYEFDDKYTAPVSGFGNAKNYYKLCSAAQFVKGIQIETLVLTARDDPLVPVRTFETLQTPATVTVHISEHGGHLGYIGRRGRDPDRRWMDWRIVDWITERMPE